jgi:hypothetical protein
MFARQTQEGRSTPLLMDAQAGYCRSDIAPKHRLVARMSVWRYIRVKRKVRLNRQCNVRSLFCTR